MTPQDLKRARLALGLTQQGLADQLKQKRLAITRYEHGPDGNCAEVFWLVRRRNEDRKN